MRPRLNSPWWDLTRPSTGSWRLRRASADFPIGGCRIPELRESPEYDILREVVLPHEARMIYLFVPDSNEGTVLGLITKGRRFRRKFLGAYFHSER